MKSTFPWFFFLSLIFIFAVILYVYHYTINSPWCISSELAKAFVKNNKIDVILDVRTKLERQTLGYYPGSVPLPSSELETTIPKMYPNKNNFFLVYCNSGQRARKATDQLHKMGYVNTMYIISGYKSIMS
jgi:rhodanese-related sulfurtransferase